MKHSPIAKLALALGLALSVPAAARAQHGHLNAGAAGTNQNDRLLWANGADFIASSGYVKTLDYTNVGRYADYFQGGITLTALPATAAHAGPDPAAPALGSYIQFRMSCLEGPEGGLFNFWESTGATPALSLAPGDAGTNLVRLSESDGSPGSDPYGHIHGRRFTATKTGIYKVGFTAVDTSTNGAGGGPIHTPSEELPVWFQAGVNIAEVEPDYEEGHVHVHFGARAGLSWQVQFSTNLGPSAVWLPAANPVTGADVFVEVIHDLPPGGQRFYRVTGTPVVP
jgi:hypothetical protein